jgi:hypothetical protein
MWASDRRDGLEDFLDSQSARTLMKKQAIKTYESDS